jgi:hypothetical protein
MVVTSVVIYESSSDLYSIIPNIRGCGLNRFARFFCEI